MLIYLWAEREKMDESPSFLFPDKEVEVYPIPAVIAKFVSTWLDHGCPDIWSNIILNVSGERGKESKRDKQTDYEGLAHMIIEADKFPDLQGESASWKPRKANSIVPIQVQRPENQKSQWYKFWSKNWAVLRHKKSQCFRLSLKTYVQLR